MCVFFCLTTTFLFRVLFFISTPLLKNPEFVTENSDSNNKVTEIILMKISLENNTITIVISINIFSCNAPPPRPSSSLRRRQVWRFVRGDMGVRGDRWSSAAAVAWTATGLQAADDERGEDAINFTESFFVKDDFLFPFSLFAAADVAYITSITPDRRKLCAAADTPCVATQS